MKNACPPLSEHASVDHGGLRFAPCEFLTTHVDSSHPATAPPGDFPPGCHGHDAHGEAGAALASGDGRALRLPCPGNCAAEV
jgi:hypothetical protein